MRLCYSKNMSGIFKRLSRLARAEFNNLGSRLRPDSDASDADKELQEAIQSASEEVNSPTWPKEIREAYAALELPLGSDEKAVKKAYRELLGRYHPDKHQGSPEKLETANEITMRVRDAYQRLLDFLKERAAGSNAE